MYIDSIVLSIPPLPSFIHLLELVSFAADPEPIPRSLGVMWEHTLNGMPVLRKAQCTHIHTYGKLSVTNPLTGMVLGGGRKRENPEMGLETQDITGRTRVQDQSRTLELNDSSAIYSHPLPAFE